MLRNDEGTEAEANSVIALLMLDSAKGRQIEVEATGPQEEEALPALRHTIPTTLPSHPSPVQTNAGAPGGRKSAR
ncbi:HPr family phosphocarrier protein [Shigella sonnei]|uniref:HPr family phosphocarrier protein n=1 Tax=Shigella sonnei TaxID=624 RepID=UPI002093FF5A|nr:HPr family phosphocarrier protein [Shigella sonnei]